MTTNQLSLSQCFGSSASQSTDFLIINKSDLPLLTASLNNTAESLITALLLQLLSNFSGILTDSTGNAVTDPAGTTISYNNSILYETEVILWKPFIRNNKIINQIIITFWELDGN